jgi:hypothetical protein
MSHQARHSSIPHLVAPLDDEASVIRPRDSADSVRPPQESSQQARGDAPVASARTPSSTRSVLGSRDERLEHKVRLASVLMQDLPATDTRVRLLNIAIMRRDEALLDGVLAELNKPAARP